MKGSSLKIIMDRYLIKPIDTNSLVRHLSDSIGIPKMEYCLAVYSTDGKYTFELSLRGDKPYFRFYQNKKSEIKLGQDDFLVDFAYIEIPENKLKYFLRMIYKFGFNDVNINLSKRLEFARRGACVAVVQQDTLIGDILYLGKDQMRKNQVDAVIKKYCGTTLDKDTIQRIIKSKALRSEYLYSPSGVINSRILSFANLQGINLSYSPSSIALKLGSKSNDFSIFEDSFELISGRELTGQKVCAKKMFNNIPNVSIIVPCYNSRSTIHKVLESINSQRLPSSSIKNIEVIIVDDGSRTPVSSYVNDGDYKFKLLIVRIEKNSGLAFARNIGLHASQHENLVFIDSDILLDANYLREHLVRLQFIPNAVFFSLKRNIDKDDPIVELKNIKSGLIKPGFFNDKRLHKTFSTESDWINPVFLNGSFDILNETDHLKLFGNGRVINGYDLPSAVIGHNLVIKKDVLNEVGGFSTDFHGWGLEDTFAGAKIISSGNFVIPVLSSGVYHINHPPRSGSQSKQISEYKENLKKYKNLINNE